jgi:Ras-related protein Rab-1A
MESEYDFLFKIIIIGDSGVGKSALLFRFSDDIYSNNYISTIGVDFKIKTIFIDGKVIKLQIWDTAGQERFRTITTSYYRGSHIILMCFDITDRSSFINLNMWLKEVRKCASSNVNIVVCGTKSDLNLNREVSYEEGKRYAETYGFNYFETSAKENNNVDKIFENSSKKVLDKFLLDLQKNLNTNTKYNKENLTNTITLNNEISTKTYDNVKNKCCFV